MNTKTLFNSDWQFAKTSLGEGSCEGSLFDDVALPHDWLIGDATKLYEPSIGWYKKTLHYRKTKSERVWLTFDGVYMNSSLFVNGKKVGEWKYGYSTFEHEITTALSDGDNEILVKVVYESPNSRWYTGAGIYRNVWLKQRGPTYIETDGVYVHTRKNEEGWHVELETALFVQEKVRLSHHLFAGEKEIASKYQLLEPAEQSVTDIQVMKVSDVCLWEPDNPHLYKLETRVYRSVIHLL
ncbi:beta-galactosidase [Bacillus sp. JCM 19046]|nr:beta-galactosidase [Bacillus sp. JCM 19046]